MSDYKHSRIFNALVDKFLTIEKVEGNKTMGYFVKINTEYGERTYNLMQKIAQLNNTQLWLTKIN